MHDESQGLWMCDECHVPWEYDCGQYVALAEKPSIMYSCEQCLPKLIRGGARALTDAEVVQAGLVREPRTTTVRCINCGRKETVDCPPWFAEGVHDGVVELNWTFRQFDYKPMCLPCSEKAQDIPLNERLLDMFGKDGRLRKRPHIKAPEQEPTFNRSPPNF